MFPPFEIPSGAFTLVTDELVAPADFLLHQAVNVYLKDHSKGQVRSQVKSTFPLVLVLSASVDLNRWKTISSKYGVNMTQHIASGLVQFRGLSLDSEKSLSAAYNHIADILQAPGALVILDDVATLEWIGFDPLDIFRFVRALRVACRKGNCSLLVRYHNTTPNEVDDQLKQLLQICSYHLEVKPLYSGRSGAVSGEIALHRGAATRPHEIKLIQRSSSLQYRLIDTGPVYFQKGTSEGVL